MGITLVRAACLHGYEALAQEVGIDPQVALKRVGLSRRAIADPDSLIPYASLINLLEHTATAASCPAFGLRLSQKQSIDVLGALALLMRHASTVGEAISLASRYIFFHSPAVRLHVRSVAGDLSLVDLTFELDMPQPLARAQAMDLSLGLIAQGLRMLGEGSIKPRLSLVPHACQGLPEDYELTIGCDCQFASSICALRIAAAELDLPLSEHNPLLKELAEGYLKKHFGAPQQQLADLVRTLLRRFLSAGQASQQDIARTLSIHPRTLQRRLLSEGRRFEDIVDEVRRESFISLVAQHQSLTQLALLLGYTEQAALTRSCKRWFGRTPSEIRESGLDIAHSA